jgi:hypothetical protein
VEWDWAGETEVVGKNLPQCHFVHHKSYMTWTWLEPEPPRWEAGNESPELLYGLGTEVAVYYSTDGRDSSVDRAAVRRTYDPYDYGLVESLV